MNLTKIEVKILKYVSKHPNCTYSEIYKKYPTFKDCFSKFEFQQLIRSDDPNANLMGNAYEDLNNPTIISLAHDGIVYLETHKILTTICCYQLNRSDYRRYRICGYFRSYSCCVISRL